MPKKLNPQVLIKLRSNPFLTVKDENIRLRAYYHWLNRDLPQWNNSESNWVQAELEEISTQVSQQLVFPTNSGAQAGDFDENYRVIFKYGVPVESEKNQRKTALGNKNSRTCSLCKKSYPAVRFQQEKHIIPEALGNRWLITYNECDDCNQATGRDLETELGNMLRAERAVARTPTKTRTAKLKLSTGAYSSLGGQDRGNPLRIELHAEDKKIRLQLEEDGMGGRLEVQTPTFRPLGALKSIAKSIWHVLPEEKQQQYDQLRRWIIGELSIFPCILYQFFIPGPGFLRVGICVWEHQLGASSSDCPPLTGVLYSGNTVLVFPLPCFNGEGIYKKVILPALPYSPFPNHYPVGIESIIHTDGKHQRHGQSFDLGFMSTPMLVYTKDPAKVSIKCRLAEEEFQCDAELHTPKENAEQGDKIKQIVYKVQGIGLGGEIEIINDLEAHKIFAKFETSYSQVPILQVQNFLKLSLIMHRGGEINIIHKESGLILFSINADPNEEMSALTNQSLVLARAIELINVACESNLTYPEEPAEIDFNKLKILIKGLEDGKAIAVVPSGSVSVSMTSKDADALEILFKQIDSTKQDCVEIPHQFVLFIDTARKLHVIGSHVFLKFPPDAKILSRNSDPDNGRVDVKIECGSVIYDFGECNLSLVEG